MTMTTATTDIRAVHIARCAPANLADAHGLLNEYFETIGVVLRDTFADVAAYLDGDATGLWLAYVDGAPAGCIVLRALPSMGPAAECKRLYVRPQFRGLGLAHALLDALETHAIAYGYASIYLDSKDDLDDALAFYRRRHYAPCARYNDNPQATLFFRKQLTVPA